MIPTLNEDCFAAIISFFDSPSLINVACTSRAGKTIALPFLIRQVTLHTNRSTDIIHFCNTVLRNRIAPHIRRLTILERVPSTESDSVLQRAVSSLADVIASAENLAWFRMCFRMNTDGRLSRLAPTLISSLLICTPCHSLEVKNINEWDWLAKRRVSSLRNLSLSFAPGGTDIDFPLILAPLVLTLESIHLELGWRISEHKFAEGYPPCPNLRMLSLGFAGCECHLADLCKAFPNVQFIRAELSEATPMPAALLSGSAMHESQSFPELMGMEGGIEEIAWLGSFQRLRMILIPWGMCNLLQLTSLTSAAIAWDSLCSLSLAEVEVQARMDLTDNSPNISPEDFFTEICRVALRLKFLSLEIHYILPNYSPQVGPIESSHKAIATFFTAASRPLAGLQDLRHLFLHLHFYLEPETPEPWADLATFLLSSLPHVKFFALDIYYHRQPKLYKGHYQQHICLERQENPATPVEGIADIVQVELSREEMSEMEERHRFESSGARLDGVAEWLNSLRTFR